MYCGVSRCMLVYCGVCGSMCCALCGVVVYRVVLGCIVMKYGAILCIVVCCLVSWCILVNGGDSGVIVVYPDVICGILVHCGYVCFSVLHVCIA